MRDGRETVVTEMPRLKKLLSVCLNLSYNAILPQKAFQNQFTIIYSIIFKNLQFGEK